MLAPSTRWKTHPLLWQQWGDEPLVYNVASGNTHVISPSAAKILRRLDQQPSTLAELAHYMASEVNVEADQELIDHIDRLIHDLDELGLVKPITE